MARLGPGVSKESPQFPYLGSTFAQGPLAAVFSQPEQNRQGLNRIQVRDTQIRQAVIDAHRVRYRLGHPRQPHLETQEVHVGILGGGCGDLFAVAAAHLDDQRCLAAKNHARIQARPRRHRGGSHPARQVQQISSAVFLEGPLQGVAHAVTAPGKGPNRSIKALFTCGLDPVEVRRYSPVNGGGTGQGRVTFPDRDVLATGTYPAALAAGSTNITRLTSITAALAMQQPPLAVTRIFADLVRVETHRTTHFFGSSVDRAAMKASCGTSTEPMAFMRFLPAFCFSSSLRLRVMSPP